MRTIYLLTAFIGVGVLSSFTVKDCAFFKNNSFNYTVGVKEVLVVFGETSYIEYHENKKYYIKSFIEWLPNCEYKLSIQESTLPNFPFKPGTAMKVKINRVQGAKIYYTATLGGRSWSWHMTKVKKK